MPRGCGCSGNSCSCLVIGGAGVTVTGTGNESAPYVVSLSTGTGYLVVNADDWARAVNLQNMVAGNITIEVYSSPGGAAVSIQLPSNAPLGTHIDLITFNDSPPVTHTLTFPSGSIYWEGGTVPSLFARRNLVKLLFGSQNPGAGGLAWYAQGYEDFDG